ncbi:MAG TPA: DUF4136 domain-containing protein [Bryobacteraceae bacterium]|nr:DUF4136 domain-containing protein [Bryobacteraceae bacterium]
MNVNRRTWLSLLAMALYSASTMLVAQVRTDHDRNVDFTRYATYSWEAVHAENPLFVDRSKVAADVALVAKGWTEVKWRGDVSISGMEVSNDHRTLRTYYDSLGSGGAWGCGGGFGGGFGSSTTTEDTYTVGTLIVDLFDTNANRLIRRDSARGTLTDQPETEQQASEPRRAEDVPSGSSGAGEGTALGSDGEFRLLILISGLGTHADDAAIKPSCGVCYVP